MERKSNYALDEFMPKKFRGFTELIRLNKFNSITECKVLYKMRAKYMAYWKCWLLQHKFKFPKSMQKLDMCCECVTQVLPDNRRILLHSLVS